VQVVQCDGPSCDRLGPQDAAGWFILFQMPGGKVSAYMAMLGAPQAETAGTFCSPVCVAEYATARALTDSVQPGEGPCS
jgi:hypothetical protein